MDMFSEPELESLPMDLHDADLSRTAVHDLLRDSHLSLPWFDFSRFENGGPSLEPRPEAASPMAAPGLLPHEELPCHNPHGLCIDLAARVLRSMHPGSSSCVLGMVGPDGHACAQPSPRGADALLSANQSALAAVRTILHCPCGDAPQGLLLVTAIGAQIGASYQQVVDIYNQRRKHPGPGAVRPAKSAPAGSQRREIFIGNHRLSAEAEAAVIRQVLWSMHRELELVISEMARPASPSSVASDPRAMAMLSGVRARMVAFLRTQVRALSSALDHLDGDPGAVRPPG